MSNYTPAPPDHHAVLEGVEHFRKLNPEELPDYADIHAWSSSWLQSPDSDPRFMEADTVALANAVTKALERTQPKAPAADWRHRKSRDGGAPPSDRPTVAGP
ncbi:MAG: hypothetical protein RBU21_10375 [FCB group bacterium]|nr:hypothetical protein [FCB group bacterium]